MSDDLARIDDPVDSHSEQPADPFGDAEATGSISFVHPSEIREALENPRDISAERYAALKYALTSDPTMMLARPIIVDAKKGDVVAGNMRLRAATDLGWTRVPVYLHEFTSDTQRREWMLRDNQEYGNWVPDELAALVRQQEADGGDLRLLGFAPQELDDLKKIGEPDLPEAGDQDTEDTTNVWAIVIDCEDEDQQQELLEELSERGLKTRALMV